MLAVSRKSGDENTEKSDIFPDPRTRTRDSIKYKIVWLSVRMWRVTGHLWVHIGRLIANGCDRGKLQSAGITLASSKELLNVSERGKKQSWQGCWGQMGYITRVASDRKPTNYFNQWRDKVRFAGQTYSLKREGNSKAKILDARLTKVGRRLFSFAVW